MSSNYNSEMFDLALKHALIESEEKQIEEADKLLSKFENAEPFHPSPHYKIRMHQLLNKTRRPTTRKFLKVGYPTIVATFLFILLSSPLIAQAVGFNLYNFLFQRHETYSELQLSSDIQDYILQQSPWESLYLPKKIPHNYILDSLDATSMSCTIVFVNGTSFILIDQTLINDEIQILLDTENAYEEVVQINGYIGTYIQTDSFNQIKYHDNVYLFSLESNSLSKTQLIQLAENLKEYKK